MQSLDSGIVVTVSRPNSITEFGLVQSLANWGAVAAVRQNAGFADNR
jgi:hypothetical protein